MKYTFLALSFLASCTILPEMPLAQAPSAQKQRQKIALLQKKQAIAEKEHQKTASELERLSAEIDQAKLALIRKQIDSYESAKNKTPNLFVEEREALYQMIQEGPSPSAFEAQAELDRILRLITEVSDEETHRA